MVDKKQKMTIAKKFGKDAKNSGSSEVQIAILTAEIEELKSHFKINPKDVHSKRGFMAKIEKRKKLINYLKRVDYDSYLTTIKALDIRK